MQRLAQHIFATLRSGQSHLRHVRLRARSQGDHRPKRGMVRVAALGADPVVGWEGRPAGSIPHNLRVAHLWEKLRRGPRCKHVLPNVSGIPRETRGVWTEKGPDPRHWLVCAPDTRKWPVHFSIKLYVGQFYLGVTQN